MKEVGGSSISRLRSEHGQIIWWLPLLIIVFFGMAGLTLDLGRAYVAYHQLQTSTDAAALAGAYALTSATSTTTVDTLVHQYGAETGQVNASPNLPGALLTTTYKCIQNNGMVPVPCNAYHTSYNVIQVTQTSTVPMYFIRMLSLFGINAANSITLRSYATATTGGNPVQMNVAIILDSTNSMSQPDTGTGCAKGATKEECALNGVQQLTSGLVPCWQGVSPCSYDSVSLFTFPNIAANTTSADTSCSGSPNIVQYTAPTVPTTPTTKNSWVPPTGSAGTYQLTTFGYTYQDSGSTLAGATGQTKGCNGIQPKGGEGTYLAGSIYAAQTALMSQSFGSTNVQNVMIILSDGDSNASTGQTNFGKTKATSQKDSTGTSSNYPSTTSQCRQSMAAAYGAAQQGTTVYTIGYGATASGSCSTDTKLSACTELEDMASPDGAFYGYGGDCATPNASLDSIFGDIKYRLSKARLVPNGISSGS
ncbi:MAG: VWA domain-containing protein [Terracidiphilus sp.]